MPRSSPEYQTLRQELGEWFGDPDWKFADGDTEPVRIQEAGVYDRRVEPAWEIRGGFIGGGELSCRGLAVVVRKGLYERDGTYRVDVYDTVPDEERQLPSPTQHAGRLFYGPLIAGVTQSKFPDSPPSQRVYDGQFTIMRRMLQNFEPVTRPEAAAWALRYNGSFAHPEALRENPLIVLLQTSRLQDKDPSGREA